MRRHAIVYSYNTTNGDLQRHIYYTSQSDGSFWRLCLLRDDDKYDKGYNYANTTMINMEIQHWLETFCMDNFNIVSVESPTIDCVEINNSCFRNRLIGNSKDPVFFVFDRYFYENYFTLDNYNECVKKIVHDAIFNCIISPDEKDKSKELFLSLQRNNAVKYCMGESKGALFKRIYQGFLSYIHSYIQILGIPQFQFAKVVYIYTGTEYKEILTSIMYVNLRNRTTGKRYIMYFMSYTYKITGGTKKTYNNILHIIPEDNETLNTGLDNKYISASMFVYKFFDYTVQVDRTLERGSLYTFLGDITDITSWLAIA